MRNKIKQIMNKEEGFTLVELLAVIVILGIIVAIAIPAVGSIVSNSENKADAAEAELIIDAARLYDIGEETPGFPVHTDTLIEKGYLELRNSDTSGNVYKDDSIAEDSDSLFRFVKGEAAK